MVPYKDIIETEVITSSRIFNLIPIPVESTEQFEIQPSPTVVERAVVKTAPPTEVTTRQDIKLLLQTSQTFKSHMLRRQMWEPTISIRPVPSLFDPHLSRHPIAMAICQIITCATKDPQPKVIVSPLGVNVIIPNPTTIPATAAPLGIPGQKTEIDGTSAIIVPSPLTLVASSERPPDAIQGARATLIGGTPFIIITGSTNILVASAPPGSTGSLTIINHTPFLAVPGPTNIPAEDPAGVTTAIYGTTLINGKPMLVIPEPTQIPLSRAPSGLVGSTTTINGEEFLVVPSDTNIPVPSSGPGGSTIGTTTLINGTPFLVIPGATQIPVANVPAGLGDASTTIINGTPFLVIPSATTVPLPASLANISGAITSIIDGTAVLIFSSATRIPLSIASGVTGGITTTIDGAPFLVIPGPTTVSN